VIDALITLSKTWGQAVNDMTKAASIAVAMAMAGAKFRLDFYTGALKHQASLAAHG
jgi:hypothetical protein